MGQGGHGPAAVHPRLLPARVYDLYIEITTLNQKLVTKKNRKVRRLRERYPEITCKVFYQRDYLSLVTKYGLEDAGSGSPVGTEVRGPTVLGSHVRRLDRVRFAPHTDEEIRQMLATIGRS